MRELNELAVPAILDGDPARGAELLQQKCARCHNQERIYDHDEDRLWWARTVRRMQREAGWDWLTDDEAASIVAYLELRR
jgi:mono/diheme cytochrome c family protein